MSGATPSIPLFGDAYLADTRHLSLEEHGAYLQLIMIAWRIEGCCLPDDDARLARMLGCTAAKWKKLKPAVMAFWSLENGSWKQARLTKERKFVEEKRAKNKSAAETRWNGQPLEIKQANGCERISERNAPPPPPMKEEVSEPNGSLVTALRPEHVVEAWNDMADRHGLPKVVKLSPERRRKLNSRIREHSIEDFTEAISAIERSPFLKGDGRAGWRANFDFLLQPTSFLKLIEGSYDQPH
jgi:uncharacterized protein YdaU (DUF1376 family)